MKKLILILVCIGLLSLPFSAMASTSAEKQVAIDKGLAYLAANQNADGSWSNIFSGSYNAADTAAALLAFVEQSYKPLGWNGANYSTVVTKAATYLLSNTSTLNIGLNWWGFNGTSGSGTSLQWGAGTGENTYITGLVIPALSRLVSNPYGGSPMVSPLYTITNPNPAVTGKTFPQVIQGGVDTFAWGQTAPGSIYYGGWRYVPNTTSSDMSTTQWGPISFLFAAGVPGVTIPTNGANSTKVALQAWLTACQNPAGGVDYYPGANIINATHAGGLLVSNLFAGGGGNVANALNWLNANWLPGPSGTWYGNEGHPYAMWAVYKGLEALFGTTGAGPIGNLHAKTTDLDPGAVWNWWEDYCQFLVTTQLSGGNWNGYSYWDGALEAAWYINILNATSVPGGGEVPEPATMILLGSGLVGLAGYARRRMKK